MSHSLQLLLLLALVIAAAKVAGALAYKVGQPAVFGELLVGLLLGPTLLDVLGWPLFSTPEGEATSYLPALIRDLADVGVVLLMFVAGLETDLDEMRRVGKVAFWSAFGGVALPFIGGPATAVAFGLPLFWDGRELGERAAFSIALILVAIATKALGCGVFARLSGFTTVESVRVGAGMISRG